MARKYTKEMVAAAVWSSFTESVIYKTAVEEFELKGLNGKEVVREIWNSDVNWSPETGRWNDSMAMRYAILSCKYKVQSRSLLENLWRKAAEVNWRWNDINKAQRFVGSCDWHLKKATDEIEIQTWQLAREQLAEYVEQLWHEIKNGVQSTTTFYKAQALWENTKAATK